MYGASTRISELVTVCYYLVLAAGAQAGEHAQRTALLRLP
jgi:hypothetical protein